MGENVSAFNDREQQILKEISLEVRSGEIVGVAGVSGNGQRPLAEAAAGLQATSDCRIYLEEREVTGLATSEMLQLTISRSNSAMAWV